MAIDLPLNLFEKFKDIEILDKEILIKKIHNLKADLENPNLHFYDF